jgi:hypothetical protein
MMDFGYDVYTLLDDGSAPKLDKSQQAVSRFATDATNYYHGQVDCVFIHETAEPIDFNCYCYSLPS